jgi:hypothetical protein
MDSWLSPVIEAGMTGLAIVLFAILSIACEAGYRLGHWRRGKSKSSTAALRARMIGGAEGDLIAALIADYAHARLQFTRAAIKTPVDGVLTRAAEDQRRIWDLATVVARRDPTPIAATLVSSLNVMFDAAQTQRFAFIQRVPPGVLTLLVVGSILAIGAMGFQLGLVGHRQPVLSCLLLAMWVGGMVLAVDLSRPRLGAIRVETEPLQWAIQELAPSVPAAP